MASTISETLAATLDRLAVLVDGSQPGPALTPEATDRIRSRCERLAGAIGPGSDAPTLAFAADLFSAAAVDFAAQPAAAERFIARFEQITGMTGAALGREVLRWPQLPTLATDVAIEVQLTLLRVFAQAEGVSLWARWPSGELKCVSHAGSPDHSGPQVRDAAAALLRDPSPDLVQREATLGMRLDRRHHEPAALILTAAAAPWPQPPALLEAAAPALAAINERAQLLASADPSRRTASSALERRLARLRFDLHDGPQQDVHLLASDLALFREQLLPIVAGDVNFERIVGRLDDLAAQLVALDGDLRRLSSSVQSPFLPGGTLPDAVRELADAFAARTGIRPTATCAGDFTQLTESQQITLLALIREALTNVREHGRARTVTITVASTERAIEAQVSDDGCGFDPETTLLRAAREGHLGLVGMHERVRMLGGRTQIDSRPGGPTTISVSLPAWPSPG